MREKLLFGSLLARRIGITPACAGKTNKQTGAMHCTRDHPRVCGKNATQAHKETAALGSPPRVREKLESAKLEVLRGRITPACAGKTEKQLSMIRQMKGSPPRVREKPTYPVARKNHVRDHPRVCGKNLYRQQEQEKQSGSPPRVREKPISSGKNTICFGITPACAGKTFR